VTVLPNLLATGAIFFALATLSRRMMPVYVSSVVLLIGYLLAASITSRIENRLLAALIDPFGLSASQRVTEYWTVAEKNRQLVPLQGVLLANRLLWMSVAALLLAFTFYRFRFSHDGAGARSGGSAAEGRSETDPALAAEPLPRPQMVPAATGHRLGRRLGLLAQLTWMAFQETVKSVYFLVIVLAGVLFMGVSWRLAGSSLFGTPTWPVTYLMIELLGGSFSLFILILVTLYAGELVWRERDAGMDQLFDALPVPTGLPFVAKLLALMMTQAVLLAVVIATGIAVQTAHGYHHYELGLYAKELFGLKLIDQCLLVVLAMTVQTLVQHKYIGHFVMVAYYLFSLFMGQLGLEHHLYQYGEAPSYRYSDMNGYGHFLRPVMWFDAYWASFAVLLAILSNLMWARGLEARFRTRLRLARQRFGRGLRLATGLALAAFLGLGSFIYYNTNILNRYLTGHDREAERADYEKRYRPLANDPQPRVTDVKVAFDLYPERQEAWATGTYLLENKRAAPIKAIHVVLPSEVRIRRLSLGGLARPTREDARLGFYTFELAAPLAPGAKVRLEFELGLLERGFPNDHAQTAVVENGTFVSSGYLPTLGYSEQEELAEDHARKKYGLAPKPRMADVKDLQARMNNYISRDADWVTFEATVSTSPDQIAIAPGYLQREWTANGRRYFHYKMDAKILHFFSVLSARYAVKRDRWRDVALEIYYHRGHEFDLDRMMKGMKAALDYCSSEFGPYPHRQLRIIEFPRYQQFAQSFPNTIPYSESVGFIAKVDATDPESVDYPFYVTAHEVAHQWWAHQVIGGNVQGATLLSETLAQYSALMVMKREYGPDQMKRFLRYELDQYLRWRALERKKELPLDRVENQQYIHYNKGSLVMYALQDYLGEATLNRALADFLKAVKFQEPPYTNSLELLGYIRRATPPDLHYLVDDLFEHITLYDNRALSATWRPRGGAYEVKLKVTTRKLRAGELGAEQERPVDDLFDVGAVDEKGRPIHLEKRRLKGGESELTLVVPSIPAKAGIDPLNKLIDRKPNDNLVRVEKE
jgi:hypothetical protein